LFKINSAQKKGGGGEWEGEQKTFHAQA